jgi:hypothetical protein
MYALICLRDFLARHSAASELLVLIASCIPALLTSKKLWEEIKSDKGFKKAWRWTEFIFLWILPVIVFLSTKAIDWASEGVINDVRRQSSNDLASAHKEILGISNQWRQSEAGFLATSNELTKIIDATKPKPFNEKLRICLDDIDKSILPGLKNGTVLFSEQIEVQKASEFKKLCSDPEAAKYIHIINEGHTVDFIGNEGIGKKHFDFFLSPDLVKTP